MPLARLFDFQSGTIIQSGQVDSEFNQLVNYLKGGGGQSAHNVAIVGNVGAGQDDLHSHSIPANTLAVDGDSLDFVGGGTILAAGSTKEVGFHVGGTPVFLTGAYDPSADAGWSTRVTVIRIDSDSIIATTQYADSVNQVAKGDTIQVNGLNFAAPIIMKWTGQDTDGVNNRVTQTMSVVRKFTV